MTPAYWILPNGKIVFVDDRHIRTVTDNPEMFDYTKRKITAIYKRHNERIGTEKKAREEIIIDLVKKGHIRIRKYTYKYFPYWAVTIDRLSKQNRKLLSKWASKILKDSSIEPDKYATVKVTQVKTGDMLEDFTVSDIAKKSF